MRGVPSAKRLRSRGKGQEREGPRAEALVTSRISDYDFYERTYDCPSVKAAPFVNIKLTVPRPIGSRERVEALEASLSAEAKAVYVEIDEILRPRFRFEVDEETNEASIEVEEQTPNERYLQLIDRLAVLVPLELHDELVFAIKSKVNHKRDREHRQLSDEAVQRWVANRVFKWGYPTRRLAGVDEVRMRMRRGNSDRWLGLYGNKYSTLAWLDAKARLADTYWATQDYDGRLGRYECWQRFDRCVDPSIVSTGHDWHSDDPSFAPNEFLGSNERWLAIEDDLPPIIEDLIVDRDGHRWITLKRIRHGAASDDLGDHRSRRIVNRWLSVIVFPESSSANVAAWYGKANLWSSGHHGGPSTHSAYLGELGWSTAAGRVSYMNWDDDEFEPLRGSTAVVRGLEVDWSRPERDRSIEHGRTLWGPCRTIVEFFGLVYAGDARWVDSTGDLIVFDPSGTASEPPMLLIREDRFQELLEANGWDFAWEVQQEKIVLNEELRDRLERCGIVRLNKGAFVDETRILDRSESAE